VLNQSAANLLASPHTFDLHRSTHNWYAAQEK